jgi:hypothetical protein
MASFSFPRHTHQEKAAAVHRGISRFYYRQAFEDSKDGSTFFIAFVRLRRSFFIKTLFAWQKIQVSRDATR